MLASELLDGRSVDAVAVTRSGASPDVAAGLGTALAMLHTIPPGDDPRSSGAPELPWAMSLHRPRLRDLEWLSEGSVDLIRGVQRDAGICDLIDAARGAWRQNTLIHGDVRWSNVVAADVEDARDGQASVRLVDWELGGVGDPAWDVGSVLAQLVSDWATRTSAQGPS